MQTKDPVNTRTGFIAARTSTKERLIADKLIQAMGLKSHSQLVRTLISSKAAALNID